MYRKAAIVVLGALVLGLGLWFLMSRGDPGTREILGLARNGAGEKTMVDAVDRHPEGFSLSAQDVIQLKQANVPDQVIIRMLRKQPNTPSVTASAVNK